MIENVVRGLSSKKRDRRKREREDKENHVRLNYDIFNSGRIKS